MYRRIVTGIVERGKTRDFLEAMRQSVEHQEERGIRARTTVWGAVTGQTNSVYIASDFSGLDELDKFLDLTSQDQSFAKIRREVRSQMVFDSSEVSIHRLAFHSEGLMSSEDATAPRRYMRILSGDVQPGKHREFVMSVSHALQYQAQHGIDATTSIWSSVTGTTNGVSIIAEFDSLDELEKFDEMAQKDGEFAKLRAASRDAMVFLTSHVSIMRNLL
ncbi:MAG: hypothetical protein U5Q44_10455 [Dehalococcoidia bacterium]|nr:hypothetical protein [Dehalococcoidia bacterium]